MTAPDIGEIILYSLFIDLIKNEKSVKSIFDHFKNFAIAAVVLAIGVRFLHRQEFVWSNAANLICGCCIIILGSFLVLLNERHGMHLLEQAELRWRHRLLILFIYGMGMTVLIVELVHSHLPD